MLETLQEKILRVTSEKVEIENYNPAWSKLFEEEKEHLLKCLPHDIIKRIEHFGSTAIPNMPAKPIIDMLVEITSLEETKNIIAPILEAQGYDYFWRPTSCDDVPPFYCWFIKRDKNGNRTHHIHMVEKDFEHWDKLYFRDYLITNPKRAEEYAKLKKSLSKKYSNDRIKYTNKKTDFILKLTKEAKEYYTKK